MGKGEELILGLPVAKWEESQEGGKARRAHADGEGILIGNKEPEPSSVGTLWGEKGPFPSGLWPQGI